MTDTTAKIRTKGLESTGVTEEIATQMHANKGRHYMAIVEVKVDEIHEKSDGTRKVDLVLTQVEPSTSPDLDEHLRELTRTLYYNRGAGDQPTLTGNDEPTVEGVMNAGGKFRPHPFLPVDASNDNGICDVCGLLATAPPHSLQDTLPEDEDDDQAELLLEDDEQDLQDDDAATDPDTADDATTEPVASCMNCGADLYPGGPLCCPQPLTDDTDDTDERHLTTVPAPFTP